MKIEQTGSHLDHMLRQTRMHHVQLSVMADLKANALITIAAVMLTFSASFIVREHFRATVMVLMTFCLLTIILATFAVMPSAPMRRKPLSAEDWQKPEFNLLFFGNFMSLNYEQFEGAMEEMMNDSSKTYQAQVREIYTLGTYLASKKYRLLRCAYLTFIVGLLSSGLTLLITVFGK